MDLSPVVAHCPHPGCGAPLRKDHLYSWCTACGEALSDDVQQRLPRLRETKVKAAAARKALGAPALVEEICAHCGTRFLANSKRDDLGFREVVCPQCLQLKSYPLPWGHRITYWAFLILLVSGAVREIAEAGWKAKVEGSIILTYLLLRAIVKDLMILYRSRRDLG